MDLFVLPAEEFIKTDVEDVRLRRKNYDRANNKYTNALSKLSNLKKKEVRDNDPKTHEVRHQIVVHRVEIAYQDVINILLCICSSDF